MILLEMLSYPFLVRAFLVGVLVSLCAALLGTSLVLKRYSMIGDGLSHVGFGALAIASALGVAPLAVAVPVVVVAAVLLLRVRGSGGRTGGNAHGHADGQWDPGDTRAPAGNTDWNHDRFLQWDAG